MIHEGTMSSKGVELLLGWEAKLLNSLRQVPGKLGEDLCFERAALSVICENPHLQRDNGSKGNQLEIC